MNIKITVFKVISEVFDFPFERIDDTLTPEDFERWDSLQQLNLMMALESKLNIHFDMEDSFKIKDVKSILEIVSSKLDKNQ